MTAPLYYFTVAELSEQVRSKDISPVQILEACLSRIEALNPRLNAFITVLATESRKLAREAEKEIEAGRSRGPLHGIPVAFKDFYVTAGSRTTAAFEHFKNRVPAHDAVTVAKLKTAGAIVIGKTTSSPILRGFRRPTRCLRITSAYRLSAFRPDSTNAVFRSASRSSADPEGKRPCFRWPADSKRPRVTRNIRFLERAAGQARTSLLAGRPA
jgi:hypothetical protein